MPVRATGLVSHPAHDRGDRNAILFFVNGRWVQHKGSLFALEEAYHSLLMVGRHPSAVVSFDVPPRLVDVNVHPTKQEVRFVYEREVARAVGAAARAAVLGTTHATAVPLVSLPHAFTAQYRTHSTAKAAPVQPVQSAWATYRNLFPRATPASSGPWRRLDTPTDSPTAGWLQAHRGATGGRHACASLARWRTPTSWRKTREACT